VATFEVEGIRLFALCCFLVEVEFLAFVDLDFQLVCYLLRDLALDGEDIFQISIVLLGP